MSNEKIWVSRAKSNHDYEWFDYYLSVEKKNNPIAMMLYKATKDYNEEQRLESEYKKELDNYIVLTKKNKSREKLALEDHPNRVYKMPEEKWECSKSIFMAYGGFIFVNETTVQILKQHNLGNSQLIKVEPYDAVSDEPIKDACSLYLLHLAEAHECCDVKKSPSVRERTNFFNEIVYGDGLEPKDGGYIVNKSVLDFGLDLWTDSRLNESIFISNQLKIALDNAGLTQDWFIYSCLVVEG